MLKETDVYKEKLDEVIRRQALLNYDVELLKITDPDKVVGKKDLTNGAFEEIKCKEALKVKEEELERVIVARGVLEKLIDDK